MIDDEPILVALYIFFQKISSFPLPQSICEISKPETRDKAVPFSPHLPHSRRITYAQYVGDANVPVHPLEYFIYAEISTPAHTCVTTSALSVPSTLADL